MHLLAELSLLALVSRFFIVINQKAFGKIQWHKKWKTDERNFKQLYPTGDEVNFGKGTLWDTSSDSLIDANFL